MGRQKRRKPVCAHLQKNRGQDDASGRGSLDVGGRQPGMEGKHRDLDGKGQEEGQEDQNLEVRGVGLPHHGRDEERALAHVEGDDGHQKEHRPGQGVEEELDGGVHLPGPAPDRDEQVHGDEHGFPQHVEQDEVQSHEHAQHGCFHEQQADHEFLDPLADVFPRTQHAQGHDQGGQQHEQKGDAVNSQGVVDV